MRLVFEDKRKRIIKNREEIKFSSFSSFHLIVISARARSEKQISKDATDDEELVVKIDGKVFPKLGSKEALLDSPAAFNGGRLHNLSKTVHFLTFLKGKEHTIILETDKPPYNTAGLEEVKAYTLSLKDSLKLGINQQAEDGDRRDWLTFVLDNLPLRALTPTITYSRRKWDSDDVKIIVDGKTQGNLLRDIRHFLWRYAGSLIPGFRSKTETETFIVGLPRGLHYIEFQADRMPILNNLLINFGKKPQPPIRIPTVDDPKWTGDFYDDPENILLARLIFGEAEGQPKEAKIGVGSTVLNRVKKQRPNWGFTNREVILKEGQYDAMWNEDTWEKVRDPLFNADEIRRREWFESYEVSKGVLAGTLTDPTSGATNFHSFSDPRDFPSWATEENYKTTIGALHFYELEG